MDVKRPKSWTVMVVALVSVTACTSSGQVVETLPEDETTTTTATVVVTTGSTSGANPTVSASSSTVHSNPAPAEPIVRADGELSAQIPADASAPANSSVTVITAGVGSIPSVGDVVAIRYEMYQWSTGLLVESTRDFPDGVLLLGLGSGVVPAVLDEAVASHPVGSRLMVIFEPGMADLPEYLDADGYVLAVDSVEIWGSGA